MICKASSIEKQELKIHMYSIVCTVCMYVCMYICIIWKNPQK